MPLQRNGIRTASKAVPLLLGLFMASVPASMLADKKPKSDKHALYNLPEPDPMPQYAKMDRRLPVQHEPTLHHAQHHASSLYGIDVSHYQGSINWQLASIDKNVRFVYIKATESGGLVDDHYHRNISEARRYGIPAGSYHFFSPTASAMVQLQNFMDNVDPKKQDLIPIVDVEKRGKGSLSDFHNKLQSFLVGVERIFGVKPIIYTGVNFFNKYLAGHFSGYKFMIARYNVEEPPTLNEPVQIVLWQFTQEGSVGGVRGYVDRSCFLDGYGLQDIRIPRK